MESNHRVVDSATPLAAWLGGKRHLAERLAMLIETIPHSAYVEPFVGMGGVFLRRRRAPDSEIINDANREIVTLFRIVQQHPAALEAALASWSPASREEFDRLRRTPPDVLTDVHRAARFLYLQRLAFGGRVKNPSFGVDQVNGTRLRRQAIAGQVRALNRRLDQVTIECLPWQQILERYDRPGVLFYLDPPYWGSEGDYGADLFGRKDFADMAARLAQLRGRFILSINDVPEIRELFGAFRQAGVETSYSVGSSHGAGVAAAELIIRDNQLDVAGPLFA